MSDTKGILKLRNQATTRRESTGSNALKERTDSIKNIANQILSPGLMVKNEDGKLRFNT